MHPKTLAAFEDELVKIAAGNPMDLAQAKGKEPALQDQKPQSETPASKANAFFGLPVEEPRKRNTRSYDAGGSAAATS